MLRSELNAAQPGGASDAWAREAAEQARDRGLTVVDDTASEAPPERSDDAPLTTDPVRWYLDRAAQHELLTAEQEMDLAKRYQAGLAASRTLESAPPRSKPALARLRRVVDDGERAKETLIRSNLRLVVPTAQRYAGRDHDLLEAIQEANIGLVRAVEKFDHTKGYKFSTYAVWWIRQAVQRGLAVNARAIRVPVSVWEDQAKVRRTEAQLREQLGRDATIDEVARAAELTVARVDEVRDALQPLASLDRPVGEDGDAAFGDLLPDEQADDPAQRASGTDARDRLAALLDVLDARQRRIIELRFGLADGRARTYDEIAAEVGLTRERVRQITRESVDALRAPAHATQLDAAWDDLAA